MPFHSRFKELLHGFLKPAIVLFVFNAAQATIRIAVFVHSIVVKSDLTHTPIVS